MVKNSDGTNGEEFSAFGVSDGRRIQILGYAQDNKRIYNFNQGPNTGGTGCSAPPLVLTEALKKQTEEIFKTTISGLSEEGRTYTGILYLGAILTEYLQEETRLHIVEWNSRWGDPEAQVIVPGIKNDLFEMSMQAAEGDISKLKIETDGKTRVAVAGMSKGYPGNYDEVKGKQIFGLEDAMEMDGIEVYGAGVKIQDGKYYANGGRLFYIVGEGEDVLEARRKAYSAMSCVFIEGNNLHYRTDIGGPDADRLLSGFKRT